MVPRGGAADGPDVPRCDHRPHVAAASSRAAAASQRPRRAGATLWEAAQRLKASKPARSLFGDAFVEHFAATREWEERQFRKAITDWELERYFEII